MIAVVPLTHDIFVSHSSVDVRIAREICSSLEDLGLACWIAPRDIVPGQSWSGAIVKAIQQSRALVVVLSEPANASVEVLREVELAARGRKTVIGVRIDDIQPSPDLAYFVSSVQWVDAFPGPVQQRLAGLARVAAGLVGAPVPPVEESPKSPEFVEVDLDDFNRSSRRRTGFVRGMFKDR